MGVEFGPEGIQHLMHGDELNSLEIPMRLLCREREINGRRPARSKDQWK
jgi:hypothetical protein